jgi:hypothetical protein
MVNFYCHIIKLCDNLLNNTTLHKLPQRRRCKIFNQKSNACWVVVDKAYKLCTQLHCLTSINLYLIIRSSGQKEGYLLARQLQKAENMPHLRLQLL